MDLRLRATREVIKDYMRLFVNRRAYTLQSMRPHPETGRHYYFHPRERGTIALNAETIREHLEGAITVGGTPLTHRLSAASQESKDRERQVASIGNSRLG